jgi:hypothetical protein
MNWITRFWYDNYVNLCLITGIFMMMGVLCFAIYLGCSQAGVKKTNKLFGEHSVTDELKRKVVKK